MDWLPCRVASPISPGRCGRRSRPSRQQGVFPLPLRRRRAMEDTPRHPWRRSQRRCRLGPVPRRRRFHSTAGPAGRRSCPHRKTGLRRLHERPASVPRAGPGPDAGPESFCACRQAAKAPGDSAAQARPACDFQSSTLCGSARAASGRLIGTDVLDVFLARFFAPSRSSSLRNDGCMPPSE